MLEEAVSAANRAESTCNRNCPNFFLVSFFIIVDFSVLVIQCHVSSRSVSFISNGPGFPLLITHSVTPLSSPSLPPQAPKTRLASNRNINFVLFIFFLFFVVSF